MTVRGKEQHRLRERIRQFAPALRLAIHDASLEGKQKVRLFYDTDVVTCLVIGFRALQAEYSRPSRPDILVRALLGSGFLGRAWLLRPHAVELAHLIHGQKSIGVSAPGDFARAVADFFEDEDLRTAFDQLERRLSGPDDSTEAEWLREITNHGLTLFFGLELADGNWQQRLVRLASTVLSWSDRSSATALKDPLVWRICTLLDTYRPGPQSSNLRDAAALGELVRMAAQARENCATPIVRFYTSHDTLGNCLRKSPELRTLLPSLATEYFPSAAVIVNSDYLLLRAAFPALRFEGVQPKMIDGGGALGYGELVDLSRRLDSALSEPDADVARLGEIRIGHRNLIDFLEELQSGSLLGQVLRGFDPPDALLHMVDGLRQFWAGPARREWAVQLDREVSRRAQVLEGELRGKVEDLKLWYRRIQRLRQAAGTLRQDQLGGFGEMEPWRDLGLVRWGVTLEPHHVATIRRLLSALVESDQNASDAAIAELVDVVTSVEDEGSCAVACSVFWALGMFDDVALTISDLETRRGRWVEPSLLLLRNAARLGMAERFSASEKFDSLHAMERLITEMAGKELGRRLIGSGYCWFHFWQSSHKASARGDRTSTSSDVLTRNSLIGRSLACGKKALTLLKNDRLGETFALNHCVYVSRMSGLPELMGPEYDRWLVSLKARREWADVWHYRFADTIAYGDYLTAAAKWRSLGAMPPKGEVETTRNECCTILINATRILDTAGPWFGDREIPTHREEMRKLARECGCLDRSEP